MKKYTADPVAALRPGATRRSFLKSSLAAGLGAGLAPALGGAAFAEASFPSRPIEILVPWGAGGGPSTISEMVRSVAQEEKFSPQPMVLNHKPGASGMIGAALVAARKGDPYTFMPGGGALLLQAVTKAFDIHPITGLTPLALSTAGFLGRGGARGFTLQDLRRHDEGGEEGAARGEHCRGRRQLQLR